MAKKATQSEGAVSSEILKHRSALRNRPTRYSSPTLLGLCGSSGTEQKDCGHETCKSTRKYHRPEGTGKKQRLNPKQNEAAHRDYECRLAGALERFDLCEFHGDTPLNVHRKTLASHTIGQVIVRPLNRRMPRPPKFASSRLESNVH